MAPSSLFSFFSLLTLSLAQPLSQQMLSSLMLRRQGLSSSGASTSTLESGVLAQALSASISQYPEQASSLTPYLDAVLAAIAPEMTNATANALMPLDRFSIANALLLKSETTPLPETEAEALSALTESFDLQTRNPVGGLWYYVYPEWSYLDGIHSILPFMVSQPSPNYTDITLQIELLRQHCVHESGLLVHGYDYSKTAVWADPVTGGSPYVWGRSLGWFMGGLVEGWEMLCADQRHGNRHGHDYNDEDEPQSSETGTSDLNEVCNLLQHSYLDLLPPLLALADKSTGAWYQLPTFPGRDGNFLESSSTMLFVWTLLKSLRLGLLPQHPNPHGQTPLAQLTLSAALKAYSHTTLPFPTGFLTHYNNATVGFNNTIGFNGTVAVNSLNSTANYTYYTTRPIVENSLLGEGAFVLGALEVEMLGRGIEWGGGGGQRGVWRRE